MDENDNTLTVRAYSMPAWLVLKLDDEAVRNERTASGEGGGGLGPGVGRKTGGAPLAGTGGA